MSALPGTLLLQGLIWNRDSALYYLKYVISLLLSQKRSACFQIMWILKHDVFCLPADSTIGSLLFSLNQRLCRKLLQGFTCMLFYYLSLASKSAETEITDNASTLRGWMWRCWVGEFNSLRVWHLRSRKTVFLFSGFSPSLHVEFTGCSITYTNTDCFQLFRWSGSEKNGSFLSCYFKSNEFLFGSSEIYANVWAQSHSYARAHTLERLGGVEAHFFS